MWDLMHEDLNAFQLDVHSQKFHQASYSPTLTIAAVFLSYVKSHQFESVLLN